MTETAFLTRKKTFATSLNDTLKHGQVKLHWPKGVLDGYLYNQYFSSGKGWTVQTLRIFELCLQVGGKIEVVE